MLKRITLVSVVCALACALFVMGGCSSQTFTPPTNQPTITTPTIKTSGVLCVGVNADNNAPLAGTSSSDSKIIGLDVDIAAALADELGLKVEIVNVGSDGANALKQGTVDIVLGLETSNSDADIWKSSSYLQTGVALFSTKTDATVPASDSNPQIAAQTSSMSSWSVTNEYGASSLVTQSDLTSAFTALKDGTVDWVAADAVIGSYAVHTIAPDAKIVALMQKATGYSIGALASNSELTSKMEKTISTLSKNGILKVIQTKWLGSNFDLSKVSYTPLAQKAVETAAAATTTAA